MSTGLLTLALLAGSPLASSGLQQGDAATFAGEVVESVDRPDRRTRRKYDLEIRFLVLEQSERWSDVAVTTRLKRTGDPVADSTGVVTGSDMKKDAVPLFRLDLIRVHVDGTVHWLDPVRLIPVRLAADTPARALPHLPIDGLAAAEFGMFPPRPKEAAPTDPWTVAVGPGRPNETWQVKATEFVNGERCRHQVVNQCSADWHKPLGGLAAWHRAESVWVSTQDGTARKLHRVIQERDGRPGSPPSAWVETRYTLKDRSRLTRQTFERARLDFEMAYVTLAEAAQPLTAKQFEARLARLDAHLERSDALGTAREALVAARRALEAARNGDSLPAPPAPPAPAAAPTKPNPWPEAGWPAPDFPFGNSRLADQRGKPAVLVFFKPHSETAPMALAIADALEKRYRGAVLIVPLTATGDPADAARQRDELKFTVPVFDGKAAAAVLGVESVPRFAIIDKAGNVHWTFTGVGGETGFLAREAVDRLVSPASQNAPSGITVSLGRLGVPIVSPP